MKKSIALLLALVMVLALCACGSKDSASVSAVEETGTDAASLREGNEIIVSARDLYDGKVMD